MKHPGLAWINYPVHICAAGLYIHLVASVCIYAYIFICMSTNGLQDTLHLIEKHRWRFTPKKSVKIIHVGGFHWACISNKLSPSASLIQLNDSLHMQPDTTIKEQCCTILKCSDDSFTSYEYSNKEQVILAVCLPLLWLLICAVSVILVLSHMMSQQWELTLNVVLVN